MSALEKNTNQLYRQKYFVDERNVIRYRPPPVAPGDKKASTVISRASARMSDVRVPLHGTPPPADAQISVQLQHRGNALSGIRIECPCGRHAALDLDAPDAKAKGDR